MPGFKRRISLAWRNACISLRSRSDQLVVCCDGAKSWACRPETTRCRNRSMQLDPVAVHCILISGKPSARPHLRDVSLMIDRTPIPASLHPRRGLPHPPQVGECLKAPPGGRLPQPQHMIIGPPSHLPAGRLGQDLQSHLCTVTMGRMRQTHFPPFTGRTICRSLQQTWHRSSSSAT
jgi:hypothetical protein